MWEPTLPLFRHIALCLNAIKLGFGGGNPCGYPLFPRSADHSISSLPCKQHRWWRHARNKFFTCATIHLPGTTKETVISRSWGCNRHSQPHKVRSYTVEPNGHKLDINWGPVLISNFQLRDNKVEEEQPWLLWPLMSSLVPKQHQHFTHTLHTMQINQDIAHSRRKEINPSFGTHLTHGNSFASVRALRVIRRAHARLGDHRLYTISGSLALSIKIPYAHVTCPHHHRKPCGLLIRSTLSLSVSAHFTL